MFLLSRVYDVKNHFKPLNEMSIRAGAEYLLFSPKIEYRR